MNTQKKKNKLHLKGIYAEKETRNSTQFNIITNIKFQEILNNEAKEIKS